MQSLNIKIFEDAKDAPNYNDLIANGEKIANAKLTDAYIVKNGTENGHPTIDLIFVDDAGNKYIAMITANLLKMPLIAAGVVKP